MYPVTNSCGLQECKIIFLRKSMEIHIKAWQLTARKSNRGHNLNQQMEQHIRNFITSCSNLKVLQWGKIGIFSILQK